MLHVDDGTLHAYLDGELPPVERSRMESHLAECVSCRERLAEERGLVERADRLLALAAPPAGHINRPVPLPRRRPRFVVPGVWAASITVAFLAGWMLRPGPAFHPTPSEPTQPPAPAATAAAPAARDRAARAPTPPVERLERASANQPKDSNAQFAGTAAESPEPRASGKALVPGVVGNMAAPVLRGAAPTPIPPTTVAVSPPSGLSSADVSLARTSAIGTTWTVISAGPARRVLGADVVRIPGLPIRDILQSRLEPGSVMVEQEVAEGTVIQLLQSRTDTLVGLGPAADLRRTVGSLQVRILGPLSTDSLLKLLQLAR
jgi:anti-sigma factor RsiW